MAALMTETDQPCSSTKAVSLPLVGFSFAHLYLRRALHLNIWFTLFAVLITLRLATHPFHHLQISVALFLLLSLLCLFCLPASMTLECTSSDDDLTLLPDDSECGSSVTSTIATCLSTYTAPSARPIELVPLNRDCYAMQILRGYDLDHVRLLFRFGIFSDSSLPRHVLRTRWKPVLGTFLSKLDQSDQPRRDVLPLSVNEMVERIERCLHFSSRHWVPLQLWIPEVMDDKEISIKINDASASVFRRIQFSDVVRQAFLEFYGPLDFAERHRGPIRGFLLWHRALKNLLYVHLSRYPSEVQKYKLIATVRPNATTGCRAKFSSRNCKTKTLSPTGLFQSLLQRHGAAPPVCPVRILAFS